MRTLLQIRLKLVKTPNKVNKQGPRVERLFSHQKIIYDLLHQCLLNNFTKQDMNFIICVQF